MSKSEYNYPDSSLVIEDAEGVELVIPCCCSDSLTTLMHFAVGTQGIKPVRVLNRNLNIIKTAEEIRTQVFHSTNMRNICPEHNLEQIKLMTAHAVRIIQEQMKEGWS